MDKDFIWSLPAPMQAFTAISQYMDDNGITTPLADVVGQAIYAWIAAEESKRGAAMANRMDGYQWKLLFLPSGTVLRTVAKGESKIAHVQGNKLLYDGYPTTPARFVNAAHGCCRNAWTSTWLRYPGDTEWQPACNIRPAGPGCGDSRRKSSNKQV
jgi:hypothetical protein